MSRTGPRHPGTASLAVKYGKEMSAALDERKDLTPEVGALFVRKGVATMPPIGKMESLMPSWLRRVYLSHQREK